MNPALWISKTGLDAQQTDISVISNNLANASTVGYKKSRAVFEDLLYQNINQPGGRSSQDTEMPSGLMLGAGAKVVANQKNFSQGNMLTTENSLDWMISGSGFFEVLQPDGNIAYSRNGQFTTDEDGRIVTAGAGFPIQPEMNVPDDAQSITVSQDGEVSVRVAGQADNVVIGQLTISDFINPSGLEPVGQNLYTETAVSGAPVQGNPGIDGLGSIVQGSLETSNVNVTEELVNLIETQRIQKNRKNINEKKLEY